MRLTFIRSFCFRMVQWFSFSTPINSIKYFKPKFLFRCAEWPTGSCVVTHLEFDFGFGEVSEQILFSGPGTQILIIMYCERFAWEKYSRSMHTSLSFITIRFKLKLEQLQFRVSITHVWCWFKFWQFQVNHFNFIRSFNVQLQNRFVFGTTTKKKQPISNDAIARI